MGKVNFLSDDVVKRIAAGEVVERPASVVKELVENSLDADAVNIVIDICKAGKDYIVIRDDGEGIGAEDIPKLFRRHATSKLSAKDDLYNISSLGFRGEALYSISSVADVVLKSATAGSSAGGREIHIRGGERIDLKDVSHPQGTTIEVRELFFNTPARKKFLKTDTTEFRQVMNVFAPYTIVHFDRRFVLTHNGRKVVNLNPASGLLTRFCHAENLKEDNVIEGVRDVTEKRLSFKCLLGDINLVRPRKTQQYVFINNRPVYNYRIFYAVNQVYRKIMPRDVYPVFAVFITIPNECVDVNIHPSKKEVKLTDEYNLSSMLALFCEQLISGRGRAKGALGGGPHFGEGVYNKRRPHQSGSPAAERDAGIFYGEHSVENRLPEPASPMRQTLKSAFYIGNYKNKYILFESVNVLLAMDQHAAHERINYERLKANFETGSIDIQRFLTPMVLRLNNTEMLSWSSGNEKLEDIGFLTTEWDKESIALHGCPQLIKDPEIAIRSILAEKKLEICDKDTLARRACKGSVLAGERISAQEAVFLRDELLKCSVPFVCPHGRPTVVEFSESFFDRQFLR